MSGSTQCPLELPVSWHGWVRSATSTQVSLATSHVLHGSLQFPETGSTLQVACTKTRGKTWHTGECATVKMANLDSQLSWATHGFTATNIPIHLDRKSAASHTHQTLTTAAVPLVPGIAIQEAGGGGSTVLARIFLKIAVAARAGTGDSRGAACSLHHIQGIHTCDMPCCGL